MIASIESLAQAVNTTIMMRPVYYISLVDVIYGVRVFFQPAPLTDATISRQPHHASYAPPSDAQAAALYKHVLTQMESNVEFLVSQNYISSNDASTILSRLPNSQNRTYKAFAAAGATPSLPSPIPASPAVKRAVPAPPPPPAYAVQARALWSYNEGAEVGPTLQASSSLAASVRG